MLQTKLRDGNDADAARLNDKRVSVSAKIRAAVLEDLKLPRLYPLAGALNEPDDAVRHELRKLVPVEGVIASRGLHC